MDLISIDDLSDSQIDRILDEGERWLNASRHHVAHEERLAGRILFNLFFENSTRTLMSFAVAAHRLGADVATLPVERSSVKKGETLDDTTRTLNAMRPDIVVVRHDESGAPARIAELMDAPVINAGDGTNEHPTQALLDALTMRIHFGGFEDLEVAIVGDIRHSRVARSNIKLLQRLGAEVRLAGPPSLIPDGVAALPVDHAIVSADVVMMLRVQRERLEAELGDAPGEYLQRYGLTAERMAKMRPHAVVMHPGPMNRGVEIDSAVADDPERSLILDQVEAGVAVRMACLELAVAD
jgi:aspartate carbamoyltransferase catalytic subunit